MRPEAGVADLAANRRPLPGDSSAIASTRRTASPTGTVMGTPEHRPPEQAEQGAFVARYDDGSIETDTPTEFAADRDQRHPPLQQVKGNRTALALLSEQATEFSALW
jgi:hypothetical protein